MDSLKKQIDLHDVVCFDIFDTLLMRQIHDAEAVFDIVGERAMRRGIAVEDYREKRILALAENPVIGPTIYEIYDRLQEVTGITEQQRMELLNLEIQTEKDVLIPRKTVVNCFYYAIAQGKHVILVSDMYLPASVLMDILEEKGICGYEKIYVSCDYRQLKYEGLFERVVQETAADSILHIGNSVEYDGYWSIRYGIEHYHVADMPDMLNHSTWFFMEGRIQEMGLNDKLLLGKVCGAVFNDPFSFGPGEVRPMLNSAYEVGYCLFAPVVTHFMVWMNDRMREIDADGILFGARDGCLFRKLYHIMKEMHVVARALPDAYFLTSRVACFSACAYSKEDICQAVRGILDADPVQVLKDIFQIPAEQIPAYDKEQYEEWIQFVLEQQPVIQMRAKGLRQNYIRYMEKMGIDGQKKYIFFDLASQGTCQHYLSQYFGLDLSGLYFWRRIIPTNDAFCEERAGCYESGLPEDEARSVMKYYLYLEAVLTDPDIPSVQCFTDQGNPVYGQEKRTAGEIQFIREAQQGIIDFFRGYMKSLWIPDIGIRKDAVDMLFSFVDFARTRVQNLVWQHLHVVDDLKGGQRVPVDGRDADII
ncbi:MAG: hypothetical protein K2N87_14595 [Eubacterium sp.]|nr:hypothetical protein [Eubacterium sp.]